LNNKISILLVVVLYNPCALSFIHTEVNHSPGKKGKFMSENDDK